MIESVDIKDISGNLRFSTPINEGSKRKFTLQKEDYLTLKFSVDKPIYFKLGDGIDNELGMFELVDLCKPAYNSNTGGFDYELRLDAYYWKWKNKIFKFTPETGGQESSWNLTATLDVHMSVFIRNLKALGYKYRETEFTFSIDGTVENKSLPMSYDKANLLDALTKLAEAWECEWWIIDSIIHFGRCEYGTPVDFELGKNVESMTRSDSQSTYATRIYAFGSTRNLPASYRPVDESVIVNGIVQKRLMLPVGTPCIDAHLNMSSEEAVEDVVVFEDVYPRRVGSVSDITTHEYKETIEEEGKPDVIKKWNAYRFKDSGITFSEKYVIPRQELQITFQSGTLNGMKFAVTFNPCDKEGGEKPIPDRLPDGSCNPEAQVWEIVRNEDYGLPLPDDKLYPQGEHKEGDKLIPADTYILSGFDPEFVSVSMIPEAEEELKTKAEKYVEKSKIDPSTYEAKMMSDYIYGIDPETSEQNPIFAKHFGIGDKVNLINKTYFENGRQSRIIGFEYSLDIPYDSPVYTIGETASYSRIGELESKIESLTYKGETYTGTGNGSGVYVIGTNDSTLASNKNVFSSLKSLASFIRKDVADKVIGIITFLNGIRIGKFVTGMIGGSGAAITVDKYGKTTYEGDRAIFREELIVPKITFNCIDVISGDKANTFSFGTIKSVDREAMLAELDLLNDQLGTLKAGDILRGVFHNLEGSNETEDSYDNNGYLNYAGFSTSYFTPTEIIESEAGKLRFRYALQAGTSVHPMKGMNFYGYGNFFDKQRQAITYENRYYTRRLKNVNTWAINPDKHIAMQDGLLEGLTIGGMVMKGYGLYNENCYFTGVQIQFTPEQKDELQGESAYSVNLSTYESVIVVDEENNIIGGYIDEKHVTTQDAYVTTEDKYVTARIARIKTRVQAFKGQKELYYTDTYHEDAYLVTLNPVGCKATVDNGIVFVTAITDFENAYVDICVNCEGNTVFEKQFKVTAVRNGSSTLTSDLDNGMDSLVCDPEGTVLSGLPFTTAAHLWYGANELAVDKIELELPAGVTGTVNTNHITITGISKEVSPNINIGVVVFGTHAGTQYRKRTPLVLNKLLPGSNGETPVIYNIQPSANSVKVDKSGNFDIEEITCSLMRTEGTAIVVSSLPDGYSMNYVIDDRPPVNYIPGDKVSTSLIDKKISFSLYKGETLVDMESIPVIRDGADGLSPVYSHIHNSNTSVACDEHGAVIGGLPVTTNVSMFYGDTELPLDDITVSAPQGITYTVNKELKEISITAIAPSVGLSINVGIHLKATYDGLQYTRTEVLSINKILRGADGKDPVIYEVLPSDSTIKVDKNGVYSPEKISCLIKRITGGTTEVLTSLPEGMKLYYSVDDSKNIKPYTYGSEMDITTGFDKAISFVFRNENPSYTIDLQKIPIMRDGKPGEPGKPGVYTELRYKYSNYKPATPTWDSLAGWFLSPEKESISFSHTGDMKIASDLYYATPFPSNDSSTYTQRIQFSTTRDNQSFFLSVYIGSGYSFRTGIVMKPDIPYSEYAAPESMLWTGSYITDALLEIPIRFKGEHFVDIAYRPGRSEKNNDYMRYRIIPQRICWLSTCVVDSSSDTPSIWSAPVEFPTDNPDEEQIYLLSKRKIDTDMPVSDPFIDKYISFADPYRTEKSYVVGNVVNYNSGYKVCVKPSTGNAPSDYAYWDNTKWWKDTPSGANKEYPYEYTCSRKMRNGRWDTYTNYRLFMRLAESYTLVPSVTQIGRSMTGAYEPGSFIVRHKDSEGNPVNTYIVVWGSDNGSSWNKVGGYDRVSSVTVDVTQYPYKYYVIRSYSATSAIWGSDYLLSVSVSVVTDGKTGASGAMPVYCGFYSNGVEYTYTNTTRDIINYKIDGGVFTFQVKVYGSVVTTPPTSSTGDAHWEPASKYKFVAMDTALIDGADIAGFMYKSLKMISRLGTLDGVETDIKDVPDSRFNDFVPHIMMDGNTGDAELNKIKVRGSVSEPFENYSSLEELRKGISMSWIINKSIVGDSLVLNFSDKKYNGQTLRIYNNYWANMSFFMQLFPSGGMSPITLPPATLLVAIGILNPSTGYVSWHLTCPHTHNSSENTYTIQSYKK